MTMADGLAVLAVILCAAAILPGTLGILMLTNKIAVSESGARYIYGKSFWVLLLSAALLLYALFGALDGGALSPILIGAAVVYAGILVFGFFMHTKLMFRPIRKPTFISVDEALKRFGPNEEVVGVIDEGGKPWGFIARLARRPHIVYQPEGDHPFIMTHCILAHSSMSYAMADRFRQPDITITAALANNMVFYDKSNQCSVIQIQNGSLNGSLPLKTITTQAMSLKAWKDRYPDSPIWMRPIAWRDIFYLKLLARADVIDPKSPVMVYPLQHDKDERLPLKAMVLGVEAGGVSKSYPLDLCKSEKLIEDRLGDVSLLVVSDDRGDFTQVFDREVDGRVLSFKLAPNDQMTDAETGSLWALHGVCLSGELRGKALTPIPHYNKIFWYVWSDFHPGTAIYDVPDRTQGAA
ncbi:hypothetical protein JCM17846_24380 [Iodidimonas nitroreducens]|uniref:DUF3179 domain-containing protein n=1 Tax=Iodidimonas nitroreducens TaxID=1236968 RepID=A0A5A7NCT1_9PROT|nr:DUF3179 domain-containing (seleno)protein [Iodidimonas nitroreducens]GAK34297.1 hypothetical protein AQ1_02195 [alpha proteobacterium Q-1]GER04756.1 hypothetical protein JCM17846_24380 [Iodidimonas nitroreducens]